MKNIISANQFTKDEVEKILSRAEIMEQGVKSGKAEKLLKDKIVACIFFEPSTRTRLSFETAALKLGAQVISAENAMENSSAHKGETIEDTTKILCSYADIIVIRHPKAGTLDAAAKVATKPLINAGDGANQHPTQGFLDLYTIKKEQGRLTNLNIGFGGDLLNSRTLRSLLPFLRFYEGNKFYFISPKELELPREFIKGLKENGVNFEELRSLEEKLPELDVLYMTRVQKERFPDEVSYNKVKDLFIFKKEHLKTLKQSAIIMHPLPKINEIEVEVDADPRAAYFRQAENGLYVRMALLCYALGL
ncbi:TPA: aspartate carbamoyltransferase [Candidatus Nomurabacteria bacterium]|uniref:Aspartate carbamoyltransferase n=2 Tax=Candidatus Nomuraibacteriota TaxID=1752729 RepID=A0A1F6YQ85_9BACT|nr:MAG: Aspartate carbamoyltransferase [Parcubacteria group bacterium GW2011_GWC1_42_21]KKS58197.1 MAG: Aspartate carbamoyltransferase [Candidatus Nomurabacteria bacterium GW2011_GWF1_42_40]KKS99304.1 MAG: Aspartate carbamoyltransferase [Candidatus Nomurabacteria bacterium GW2011_GWA1_43_17]KKT07010.1 MAG: Aspartate carbamoyltransferase [Candidatus Nomurabacteria bacterium GW2011_GWB1_43_19]KKT10523.1 MAG: Aspartate carbamoyltransferase [Candidatus Nomurabacteria bacterium GW2011_GWF2_43_24]KK